ncbi:Rqc2 family fibronectin-binding protein [Salinithrix halophila]|uniref:Rqc2 homolog RqcH n=1 Tax=Salinithrix halophila TaxID=1485204 RepID=A0ABV8JIA2_9BACL
MSFDGIVARAVVYELREALIGGRVAKIYQPTESELIFHTRSGGANRRLLLSAHPAYPRLHLTETTTDNPLTPPMFCMLLRKHCEGGIIQDVRQIGLERIIHIDIQGRDELGFEVIRRLVVEIMGRHSNVILLDPASNKILDSLRRVSPAMSRHRQVMPGISYQSPPEQNKKDPLSIDRDGFLRCLSWNQGRLDKQIIQAFSGIGPQTAREILYRGGLGEKERLWEAFNTIMDAVREGKFHPSIVYGEKTVFSALPLTHLQGEQREFERISHCLDAFYHGKAERDRARQQNHDLIRNLKNAIDKNENKRIKLKKELTDTQKADTYRIHGELVTASMHQVKRGDESLRTINYYDPEAPEITIPLDPRLSPSENAQRYFKLYNKAKAARKWNREQIDKTIRENEYLESVLVQLQDATLKESEEIREELEEQGWLKAKPRKKTKKKPERPRPVSYRSSEGVTILVGRNNKQNDYLTHRLASSSDTWLHTKEIPGSHVVIRGKAFGEPTLYEAAMLAAWHSKGRESSQVPVDFTLIRHVNKPSGAPPGFVTYEEQKTLFVTPDEHVIRKLEKNGER